MICLGGATQSPLTGYVDHARVLVISATAKDDPELHRQELALSGSATALSERQIVVIRAIGPTAQNAQGRQLGASSVRTAVGLAAGRFGVALVGKDGGVKLRRAKPVEAAELLQTIDAMPMRRQEMLRNAPG